MVKPFHKAQPLINNSVLEEQLVTNYEVSREAVADLRCRELHL